MYVWNISVCGCACMCVCEHVCLCVLYLLLFMPSSLKPLAKGLDWIFSSVICQSVTQSVTINEKNWKYCILEVYKNILWETIISFTHLIFYAYILSLILSLSLTHPSPSLPLLYCSGRQWRWGTGSLGRWRSVALPPTSAHPWPQSRVPVAGNGGGSGGWSTRKKRERGRKKVIIIVIIESWVWHDHFCF